MLEVSEGQTIGIPLEFPAHNPGENQNVTFLFPSIELSGYNSFDGDNDIRSVDAQNGVCITPQGRIQPSVSETATCLLPDTRIYWQKRKLSGAGTMGAWSYIYPVNSSEDQYEGNFLTMEIPEPGIYQLQAVYSFSNGQQVEFPLLRMGNAKSIKNGDGIENPILRAGKPDYFGVSRNDRSVFIREEAIKWLGSNKYGVSEQVVTDPDTTFQPTD